MTIKKKAITNMEFSTVHQARLLFQAVVILIAFFPLKSLAYPREVQNILCNYLNGPAKENQLCNVNDLGRLSLNSLPGKVFRFYLKNTKENVFVWWPLDSATGLPCEGDGCTIYIQNQNLTYIQGRVTGCSEFKGDCSALFLGDTGPQILRFGVPSKSIEASRTRVPYMKSAPVNLRGLGPKFTTYGLNRFAKNVRKIHQPIITTMVGGRNLLGHGVVQFNVLSYEPAESFGYNFRLSVNCFTRQWSFLENDAKLMGGALEGFGLINGIEMGRWACAKYGFSY